MAEQIIVSENLCFQHFLRYPDIQIEKNTVTFISGASGCGKSTFLKLCNGTYAPSAGYIMYRGKDISALDKIQLRREVLLVKQVPYLFRGSIRQNFMMFHQFRESHCPEQAEINYYLERCCMQAQLETNCDTLSGGERQRVFLSIALSLKPDVLLLDEPTSALNKELSNEVLQRLVSHAKQQNISLVIISHDMALQSAFAEKVIELERIS